MPKRHINLYKHDDIEYKTSDLFTEEELLNDPECFEILSNQHYFDFEHKISDKISNLFQYYADIFSSEDFLYENQFKERNDRYDCVPFLPTIYKYIQIKYDFELLYKNPKFTYHLFNEKQETNKVYKKVTNTITITNSKKHNWNK